MAESRAERWEENDFSKVPEFQIREVRMEFLDGLLRRETSGVSVGLRADGE
jgi:hypothetical protein